MDFRMFNKELGNADLVLIDQILKGRFGTSGKILDAGCGEGRNLNYFFQNDFDIYGIDKNNSALKMLVFQGKRLSGNFKPENFFQGDLAELPFENYLFDYILCISVLHFAETESEFYKMTDHLVRVLKTSGILLMGMNSVFGTGANLIETGPHRYRFPDHSERFLLDHEIYKAIIQNEKLELLEPLKTITVHEKESNSYLVLKKTI